MIAAIVSKKQERAFVGFAAAILISVWSSIYFNLFFLSFIPFGLAFVYLSALDFKWVYFFLIISIPLSFEFHFSKNLGTDLPDEALMLGLTILGFAMIVLNARRINASFFLHPLALFVFFNFLWMAVCVIFAEHTTVALKVVLAKIWYIVPFMLLTATLIDNEKAKKIWYWCLTTPLVCVVVYTLFRHYQEHFTFDSANHVMEPFFRNHVNYAEMLTMVLPFTIVARTWYPKGSNARRLNNLFSGLILAGILFSYTRLAWLSVPVALVFAVAMKKKLLLPLFGLMLGTLIIFFFYMGANKRYLYHPPDFATTIQHHKLNEHIQATYGVKDVSNAERLYRWIAGVRMWADRPFFGYGPGNFYFCYKPYTVNSFQTYVSDNEERSTVHNYYLLTLIEQGAIGCIIFIMLITAVLFVAQKTYSRLPAGFDKSFLLAVTVCFMLILFNITANDMIETDKVGSLFYMSIAFIINASLKRQKQHQGILVS